MRLRLLRWRKYIERVEDRTLSFTKNVDCVFFGAGVRLHRQRLKEKNLSLKLVLAPRFELH